MIAHRVDDLYAHAARLDGRVTEVTEELLKIEYKDGTGDAVELGTIHGKAAGLVYPHQVVSDLRKGAKVSAGDIVSFNSGFFTRDQQNPTQVRWKSGRMATTAILESSDTLEDSSAITTELAEHLVATTTVVRDVRVTASQEIHNLVSVGDDLEKSSIICMISDPIGAGGDLFTEDTVESLKLMSNKSPSSGTHGTVEKIEIIYHGEIESMTESLKKLVRSSDRKIASRANGLGRGDATNGQIKRTAMIGGEILNVDELVIRVYIRHETTCGVGDKAVFSNSLKTVFGRMMTGVNETESGVKLDAIFGYVSIANRMVLSAEIMGTTNALLKHAGHLAANAYLGEQL